MVRRRRNQINTAEAMRSCGGGPCAQGSPARPHQHFPAPRPQRILVIDGELGSEIVQLLTITNHAPSRFTSHIGLSLPHPQAWRRPSPRAHQPALASTASAITHAQVPLASHPPPPTAVPSFRLVSALDEERAVEAKVPAVPRAVHPISRRGPGRPCRTRHVVRGRVERFVDLDVLVTGPRRAGGAGACPAPATAAWASRIPPRARRARRKAMPRAVIGVTRAACRGPLARSLAMSWPGRCRRRGVLAAELRRAERSRRGGTPR